MTHRRMVNERRQRADGWLRLLWWVSGLGWCVLLLVMLAFHLARPETNFGLWRYDDVIIRSDWLASRLPLLFYSIWGCLLLSLVALALSRWRGRRRDDSAGWYAILLLAVALASLSGYLLLVGWG